jgi:hypothetical protein
LKGGVFTRQSESTFLDNNGNVVGTLYVRQNFTGFSEDSQDLNVDINVEADLPALHPHDAVIYPDFEQNFEYQSNRENPDTRKLVEYRGSIEYKLTTLRRPTEFRSFRIDTFESLHFAVCVNENDEKLAVSTANTRLSTKKMFVTYSNSERLVRFTSANNVKPLDDPTPDACEQAECSEYAECVADVTADEGFFCHCKPGFSGDGHNCTDTNECVEEATHCSRFAECINQLGHYECRCLPPRTGDGRACELLDEDGHHHHYEGQNADRGDDDVDGVDRSDVCSRCDRNARCVLDEGRGVRYCQCSYGFQGNGYTCHQGIRFNLNQN